MSTAIDASTRVPIRSANLRQAYERALAGALGAVFGLYLYVELIHAEQVWVRDALAGLLIGGSIGFFLNASAPFREGAWLKLGRLATWGTAAGALGGAIGLVLGEMAIGLFQGGLLGRAVSWSILGISIGISQGLADRARQRLVFGLIGGGLGGLIGGYLFEWLRGAFGNHYTMSQGIGIVILGAGLGLLLALVEQALRRAWVQVLRGRQEGQAYLLAHKLSRIGLDERAEVGLFGDSAVARQHAEIEDTSQGYLLRNLAPTHTTRVNGADVKGSHLLKDGDRLELGQTLLVFRQRSR